MNTNTKSRSWEIRIFLLMIAVYVANITSKNLYTAEIIEIIKAFPGTTKAEASLATTYYFIPYAVMQLVIFKITQKINIIKVFTVTSLLSVGVLVLVPFCTDLRQIYALFVLNGFFNAMTWPTVVYVLTHYLSDYLVAKGTMMLSAAFGIGYVLDFLLSAFFIRFFNWRISYWVVAAAYLVMILLFYYVVSRSTPVDRAPAEEVIAKEKSGITVSKNQISLFLVILCGGSLLACIAYYGMQNWVTTFFHEVFETSSSMSSLLSTLVPIFATAASVIANTMCEKMSYWKYIMINAVAVIGVAVSFLFFYDRVLAVSLAVIALLIMLMRSFSTTFGTIMMVKSRRHIDTTSIAALTNTFASAGAAIGPPLFGKMLDGYGWSSSYLSVVVLTAAVLIFVLIFYQKVKIFAQN